MLALAACTLQVEGMREYEVKNGAVSLLQPITMIEYLILNTPEKYAIAW